MFFIHIEYEQAYVSQNMPWFIILIDLFYFNYCKTNAVVSVCTFNPLHLQVSIQLDLICIALLTIEIIWSSFTVDVELSNEQAIGATDGKE